MNRIAKRYDYDRSKYVGAVTFGIYGSGERCLHDDVVKFEKVTFEGHSFNAPGGYDKYLTQIFGEYMQLPPEDQRHNHYASYIDFGEEQFVVLRDGLAFEESFDQQGKNASEP